MWMIVEIIKDPSLLQAIREEVASTVITDSGTGARSFDGQKLVTLPLLQSVFTETLRLRMNFNIIRHAKEPVTMDGFTLPKGAMLQAPMMAAHYDPAIWTAADHPASEFWAERHVKYTEERDEAGNVSQKRTFATAGRPSSYFPFGMLLSQPTATLSLVLCFQLTNAKLLLTQEAAHQYVLAGTSPSTRS